MSARPSRGDIPLPKVYRPFGARMASSIGALVLVAMVVFLWVMLPPHVKAEFGWFQRSTLLLFFVVVVVLLYGVFRTRVTASPRGLVVRNGYRRHELYWAEVVALSLGPNRPWASLDLDDGSTIAVMALQSADGPRATRSAQEISALIAAHSVTERDD